MFNFIKNFGYSIGSQEISALKLEDLNVRKCINLEIKRDHKKLTLVEATLAEPKMLEIII